MSLFIGIRKNGVQWHLGESVPEISNRVVVFQADGDELEMILDAMRNSRARIDAKLGQQPFISGATIPVIIVNDSADDGPEIAILSVKP